ncbi:MAG: hypothetical protein ACKVS5_15395 [Parvularculaceae bacterium]
MFDDRLRFDLSVAPGGYAWWYIDALSPDGDAGLTIIAFIGSVFSPYYAWSGRSSPANHCALNVALYAKRGSRWAMTERSRRRVEIAPHRLAIGASALSWSDCELTIAIHEVAAPLPFPVRGVVKLRPQALTAKTFAIDADGKHRWRPLSPRAAIEVAFENPSLEWQGEGYFDSNDGDEPLEDAFQTWNWARLYSPAHDPVILYDTAPRSGPLRRIAIEIGDNGAIVDRPSPELHRAAPAPIFRMERLIGAERGAAPVIVRTLEDAPFYSRSIVETKIDGVTRHGFHESLSGDRLRSPLVRAMLPFRMPRHNF